MKRKNQAQSYYGTFAALLLVLLVFSLMILSVAFVASKDTMMLWILIPLFAIPIGIPTVIMFVCYFHYRNAVFINIQTVTSTSIDFSFFYRDRAALIGEALINGVETKIITTYTFTTHVFSSFVASDYMDKDVLVGYDPKWGKWVVIEDM